MNARRSGRIQIPEESDAAMRLAAGLFREFGMPPKALARDGKAAGILSGELHGERHLMFVHLDACLPADRRQGPEPSSEELALARDLQASPHVLRCDVGPLDPLSPEVRDHFQHLGIKRTLVRLQAAARFRDHVARSRSFARSLRGRVTVAGHLARLGGRVSRLRLGVIRHGNQLALRLRIDDREPALEFWGSGPHKDCEIRCCVDHLALLRLSSWSGKGTFLTCSCGEPECLGIPEKASPWSTRGR